MQYPPNDQSSAVRAEAAAAFLAAIREVRDVLDRLQLAAAWVLDAFGDTTDAETIRMLPVAGSVVRPGRPPVPPTSVTGDEKLRLGQPLTDDEADLYGPPRPTGRD